MSRSPDSQNTASSQATVQDSGRVRAIAGEIRDTGLFALDLEFVSESRYIPELCLVQVGWGDPAEPSVAAVDPLSADPEPIFELVEDSRVDTVLHSAQADLALLGTRHDVAGRAILDTQIAAAFLGLGDQLGYGNLVEELTGTVIDKGSQFTNWCRRPLTDKQLRYALDDVRYLLGAWVEMRRELEERGRLEWVEEESRDLAREWAERTPPEDLYLKVRGWQRLDDRSRGALRELAAWRERQAVEENTPPKWLLKDGPLLEVARRRPESLDELRRVKGVGKDTVRRHGRAILEAAVRRDLPVPDRGGRRGRLPAEAKNWGSKVLAVVRERCQEADVATRFVASRRDADAMVQWFVDTGGAGREPDLPLLRGWRRELAGEAALDWLREKTSDTPGDTRGDTRGGTRGAAAGRR